MAAPVLPIFAAVVGAVAVLDVRALHEDTFLANLGVGARLVFAAAFVVALAAESIILTLTAAIL